MELETFEQRQAHADLLRILRYVLRFIRHHKVSKEQAQRMIDEVYE